MFIQCSIFYKNNNSRLNSVIILNFLTNFHYWQIARIQKNTTRVSCLLPQQLITSKVKKYYIFGLGARMIINVE